MHLVSLMILVLSAGTGNFWLFTMASPLEGKSHCLVMVNMWSKWVEAFPASKQTASVVTKALLQDIIPQWGIPSRI